MARSLAKKEELHAGLPLEGDAAAAPVVSPVPPIKGFVKAKQAKAEVSAAAAAQPEEAAASGSNRTMDPAEETAQSGSDQTFDPDDADQDARDLKFDPAATPDAGVRSPTSPVGIYEVAEMPPQENSPEPVLEPSPAGTEGAAADPDVDMEDAGDEAEVEPEDEATSEAEEQASTAGGTVGEPEAEGDLHERRRPKRRRRAATKAQLRRQAAQRDEKALKEAMVENAAQADNAGLPLEGDAATPRRAKTPINPHVPPPIVNPPVAKGTAPRGEQRAAWARELRTRGPRMENPRVWQERENKRKADLLMQEVRQQQERNLRQRLRMPEGGKTMTSLRDLLKDMTERQGGSWEEMEADVARSVIHKQNLAHGNDVRAGEGIPGVSLPTEQPDIRTAEQLENAPLNLGGEARHYRVILEERAPLSRHTRRRHPTRDWRKGVVQCSFSGRRSWRHVSAAARTAAAAAGSQQLWRRSACAATSLAHQAGALLGQRT